MAGFRVAEHDHWRDATPRGEAAPEDPTHPLANPEETDDLRRRLEALGPIAYPARLYDGVFGRWSGRSRLFLVLRFMLVIFTVVLLIGGVNGEALVTHEVGAYRTVNPGGISNHYLTEGESQRYLVEAAVGLPNQIFASLGYDHGIVRVPTLDAEGPDTYGLQIKLVRGSPDIRPELGLQRPDGNILSTIPPTSDDGVTIRYDVIPIDDPGSYKFVMRADEGAGRVDLHVAVAAAPVEPVERFQPDWVPLFGGIGLGTLLVGAYTPGATTLAELRRARDEEDTPYQMAEDPTAFYDRVVPIADLESRPDAQLAYRDE